MDIKITSGIPGLKDVQKLKENQDSVKSASESTGSEEILEISSDKIDQVASMLEAGEISGGEARKQILAEVMDMEIVKNAPADLKEQLEQVLETLMETDPYLISLKNSLPD